MSYSWTQDELRIAWQSRNNGNSITDIVDELWQAGYQRSYDGVRKMLKKLTPFEEESLLSYTITTTEENHLPLKVPKILLLDIETLPLVVYTWGIWKQNISDFQIIKDWCILCWSAKWMNDSTIYSDILTPEEVAVRDDSRICTTIWDLMNEANVIVAQNGDDFDIKKLNARFIQYNMGPPSPYLTIDTLKQSRKNFAFTSHKLDFISKMLLNQEKIKTGFSLWQKCDNGEQWALDKMLKYNNHDVTLLEDWYLELLPWIKGGPNLSLYTNLEYPTCGHCGCEELVENGTYCTSASRYKSYKCANCGAFVRDRVSDLTKEERENLKLLISK